MEGKTSFILYCDLMQMVHKMPDEDAGKLFKLIFEYTNDQEPDESKYGILVEVAFAQIKQILKRDLVKWNETKEGKSIGGRMGNLKRYQNDLYLQVVDKKLTLEKAEEIALTRKPSHSDTIPSDTELIPSLPIASVAVNVNDNVNGRKGKGAPSELEVVEYFEKNGYTKEHAKTVFEYYDGLKWTDKNKVPIDNWKYHLRKQWMKEDGKPPLTREEVMHINNNPPVSQDNWNRMSRSQQHNYNVLHGGSGFPLKDK